MKKRRDPLLVTTSGVDRVMVQCFPVFARGGTMKIRIGITAPLVLKDREQALLLLPRFVERNFRIGKDKRHLVWIESKNRLRSTNEHLGPEQPSAKLFALRGELTESELLDEKSAIRAERSPNITSSWCEDTVQGEGRVVIQKLEEKTPVVPERIVLVVDGSKGMRKFIPQIVEAMAAIPSGVELAGVITSADEPSAYVETGSQTSHSADKEFAQQLSEFDYAGGRDNVPALARALKVIGSRSRSAIVWIHSPPTARNADGGARAATVATTAWSGAGVFGAGRFRAGSYHGETGRYPGSEIDSSRGIAQRGFGSAFLHVET